MKEVETPKSNVRNTTRAEVRVKRCEDETQAREEREDGGGGGGRQGSRKYLERSIRGTGSETSVFGEITEESYAHFAESRPKSRRQSRIGLEIALSPPSSISLLVLSSALRALDCSISDIRMALNLAQWRGCNAI